MLYHYFFLFFLAFRQPSFLPAEFDDTTAVPRPLQYICTYLQVMNSIYIFIYFSTWSLLLFIFIYLSVYLLF